MKINKRMLLSGALLWLSVFIASFLIYPVKQSNPAFFETLIAIVLSAATVVFARMYFARGVLSTQHCVGTGFVWAAINVLLDLPLFSFGPMKRDLWEYFSDIGCTYLIIPLILSLLAFRSEQRTQQS